MDVFNHSLNRRSLCKLGAALALSGDWFWQSKPAGAAELPPTDQQISPEAALTRLMAGNQRFNQYRPQHPDQSRLRLVEVAQTQHPFATILSCADSRVPAELLFDQGIGDLFDVRIAGNIATPEAIGSIEYAVVLLGTPLLMVLGHERCGAVTAAVENKVLPDHICTLVQAIQPAVERVKAQPGNPIENAVTANVQYQIEQLQRSPLLAERLQSGQLKIVGGRYDLDTGSVTIVA